MKNLVYGLLMAVLFTACEKSEQATDRVSPSKSLTDEQIREKVAGYYSVPSATATPGNSVKAAFGEQFPGARDVEWEYSNGVYEVDFEIGNVDHEAWYDADAQLIMYKYDIRVTELPAAVQNAVTADYPGYRIDEAEKVFKGTAVGYCMEIELGKSETEVFYHENGTFIANSLCECDRKPGNSITNPSVPTDGGNVTGSYTTEQIQALLAQYFAARSVDVAPAAAVSGSFSAQFPNARDVEWEAAGDVYNVDFEIANVDYEAWYDQNGVRLAYAYDISRPALPQVVKDAAAAKYPGYRIDDTERIYVGEIPAYSLEMESGKSEIDAIFTDNGSFMAEYRYR
jgi:hypothetical protein